MDAITLLKNDHRDVEKLFKRFERAGDRAYVEKRAIVDRIIEALSRHAVIEEQLFYPVTRATVPDIDDLVLESLEEHHVVKWVLSELEGLDPQDERFDAKVTVLMENVRHHVKEEEGDYFPKVRDELGRRALTDLGDTMEAARKVAPTHPHPNAPDTPPGNIVAGAAAAVTDRVSDTIGGVAQGTVTAAQDVIARIVGRQPPKSSPTGSKNARDTAIDLRDKVDDVTETAIEKVKGARRTGNTAANRAKRTSTTARRSTTPTGGRTPAKARKRPPSAARGNG